MGTSELNEFVGFAKMARMSRECYITEKIDGTNAQIFIAPESAPITLGSGRVVPFLVGSRTRWIFPENDNHGFAKWAYENAEPLLGLGPGRHFGEWWGCGIQRGYGLKEKRFSLFNVGRWKTCCSSAEGYEALPAVQGLGVVPILWQGIFSTERADYWIKRLRHDGSVAAPGFMKPEGIVIYHVAGNVGFKKTIENDEMPKNLVDKGTGA